MVLQLYNLITNFYFKKLISKYQTDEHVALMLDKFDFYILPVFNPGISVANFISLIIEFLVFYFADGYEYTFTKVHFETF